MRTGTSTHDDVWLLQCVISYTLSHQLIQYKLFEIVYPSEKNLLETSQLQPE